MKKESMQILLGTPDALTIEVVEPKLREITEAIDEELAGGCSCGRIEVVDCSRSSSWTAP